MRRHRLSFPEAAGCDRLRRNSLAVEGHSDSVGSDQYHRQFSERRAQAVRDYLVQRELLQERGTQLLLFFFGLPASRSDCAATCRAPSASTAKACC
jgi:hypothetical protein